MQHLESDVRVSALDSIVQSNAVVQAQHLVCVMKGHVVTKSKDWLLVVVVDIVILLL